MNMSVGSVLLSPSLVLNMPDGDIYHSGIASRFQRPYRMLCEGIHEPENTKRQILDALKNEIQKKSDMVVHHAHRLAAAVERAISQAGLDVDYGCIAASEAVDRMRYHPALSPRVAETVCGAAKDYIHDIRHQKLVTIGPAGEQVLDRTFQRIYRSEFEDRVLNKQNHYNGADPGAVQAQLDAFRPDIEAACRTWARKANAEGSLKRLKRPPFKVNPISLDENLL